MAKPKFPGMQHEAGRGDFLLCRACVDRITNNRGAKGFHMDSDLMGSAGVNTAFHETGITSGRIDGILGDCRLSRRRHYNRHLLPVMWITCNAIFDAS